MLADQELFEPELKIPLAYSTYVREKVWGERAFIPLSSKPLPRKHTWARSKYRIPISKNSKNYYTEREKNKSHGHSNRNPTGTSGRPSGKRCVSAAPIV